MDQAAADVALDRTERELELICDVRLPSILEDGHPDDRRSGVTERCQLVGDEHPVGCVGRVWDAPLRLAGEDVLVTRPP